MELFDFVKVMFEKPEEYQTLSRYEKGRFFFMTNRFMSIMYPLHSNALNNIKISQPEAVDYWQTNMRNMYKSTPPWIFAKGKKKSEKSAVKKKELPSKEAINMYLQKQHLSKRQLDEAEAIFGDCVYDPIRRLDKAINQ